MSDELSKVYDAKAVEGRIYERWMEAGAFDAEPDDPREPYCIVIPPPNVTSALHVGHALDNTLQDVLIRWRRMQQRNTLWMPGTDHAGIATQTVVEKRILAAEGKRRTDFERDEFLARLQAWKDEYEARIIGQLKLMGCSCDWRRIRFTMDDVCARAVRANFFGLFADGLIYRGKRLVNWDPATQTVLADDEVEHETVQGHFWYMRYPLVEPVEFEDRKIDHVTVATTRPETMLGDTAVAINPADPRAEALLGKGVRLPLVGRIIRIIADEHVVLPDPDSDDEKARFSTGFLKVTPAHDPDDYEIGLRHGLRQINIFAPDATLSDKYGWDDVAGTDAEQFLGMDRFEAREAIVEWFRTENLLADVRPYTHEVGHSYRSHVPIEPYLSDQWYIAVKKQIPSRPDEGKIEGTDIPVNSLTGLALKPLLDGRLKFTPERYARTYQTWLENLRDWPISRQLWWGHRIPIWSQDIELPAGAEPAAEGPRPDARTVAALDRAVKGDFDEDFRRFADVRYHITCARDPEREGWIRTHICIDRDDPDCIGWLQDNGWSRDPDVLDTWFSSALWPFSTMGWPQKTAELARYYPGHVLCTAREIITLWVSRMVMMGQYCCGDIPFADVFIHAMIQDGEGRKMSKSLGNGIDPLDIIDSHGADAMRFTLVSMTTQTQDVRMPVERVTLPDGRVTLSSPKFDIGRNFCNKLWNAARFAMMNLDGAPAWSDIDPAAQLADRWILSRLGAAIGRATDALEGFRFNELADVLYHFIWDEFCDWYLEIAKARINAGEDAPKALLGYCLDTILRLLHPITPFITEAIWEKLNAVAPCRGPACAAAEALLVRAHWPEAHEAMIDPDADAKFATFQELIGQVRNARKEHNVPPRRKVDAIVQAPDPDRREVSSNVRLLRSLGQLGDVRVSSEASEAPADAVAVTVGRIRLYLLGIIDRDAELVRLSRQAETLRKGIRSIVAKLENESFLTRAPDDLIERERKRLISLEGELEAVNKSLEGLGG